MSIKNKQENGSPAAFNRDIVIIPGRRRSGMTYREIYNLFPTEKEAIDYFFQIRYKGVLTCPHCGSTAEVYRYRYRNKVCHCHSCNNSFSPFSGTIFEKTHRDIRDWFYAINKIAINGRKGISACELQRDIGGGYHTALRMLQQIRKAMGNVKDQEAFECIVEVDETYVGGKHKGSKRGRGADKIPAVGVLERNSGRVHIKVALPNEKGKRLSGVQLMDFIQEGCKSTATVITDELKSYSILDKKGSRFFHLKVNHSQGEYCNSKHPWIHTNGRESVWALVKRAYIGIYHHYSLKYMQRYMDEVAFRQSHRTDDRTFDVVLEQSIGA
jgi:transposase-like protein